MQALQEHLCEQDNSDNSASSVSFTQTEELIASTTVTINTDKLVDFPFKRVFDEVSGYILAANTTACAISLFLGLYPTKLITVWSSIKH